MLAKRFVSRKIERGFDENKLEKSRIEKTPLFKKIGYSVLGLRKPNKRQSIHFGRSHNAEICKTKVQTVKPFEIF